MKNVKTIFLVLLLCGLTSYAHAKPPNVVFILVDNTGWGDFSVYGGATATPRIDSIAQQGLRLSNYTVQAQCVPTRSAIMTGRLPTRSGTTRVPAVRGAKYGLSSWEYTLGELFSDAGYQTALMGKWHLGDKPGRFPTDQGFDQWYGIANSSGEAGYVEHPLFALSGMPAPSVYEAKKGQEARIVKTLDLKAKAYLDEEIAERSTQFIQQAAQSEAPFFLYVGFSHMHPPATIHPDFVSATDGKASYADVLREMDVRTGQVLDAIKEAGIEDDTIVVFSSDNATAPYGDLVGGSNGPFRGHFFNQPYEGSHRVAAMLKWPGTIPAQSSSDQMLTATDWLPTFAGLIGQQQSIPEDRPIDGIDASAHVLAKAEKSGRDHVIFHGMDGSLMSVKWQDFKVVFRNVGERDQPVQKLMIPQMYNLKDDPREENNLTFWRLEDAWITAPVSQRVMRLKISERIYPNVKTGEDFSGYNPLMTWARRQYIKYKLGANFPEGL